MPPKRKYESSAASSAAKRGKTSAPANGTAKRKYAKANQRVGGFNERELKYFDVGHAQQLGSSGIAMIDPAVGCLSCPGEGTGPDKRDGQNLYAEKIYVQGLVRWGNDPAAVNRQLQMAPVKVWLIKDSSTNSAAMTPSLALKEVSLGMTTIPGLAMNNLENSKRFRILDSIIVEPPGIWPDSVVRYTGSQAPGAATYFKLSADLKGERITMAATGNSIGAVKDVSYHLLAGYMVDAAQTDSHVNVEYISRLRYRSA